MAEPTGRRVLATGRGIGAGIVAHLADQRITIDGGTFR